MTSSSAIMIIKEKIKPIFAIGSALFVAYLMVATLDAYNRGALA